MKYLIILATFLSSLVFANPYTKKDLETGSFTTAVTNLYVACEYNKQGKFIEGRLITIKDNQIFTLSTLDENTCSIFKSKG